MSAPLQRLFWGWDKPVLESAVSWLTADWDQRAALDLSETLIIVPTAEAGRRLKEALARHTDAEGSGAIVPHVWPPEQALMPAKVRSLAATRLQAELAWQQAIQTADLAALNSLFPVLPEHRSPAWVSETARMLSDLKSLLGAGGLTFASMADAVSHDGARWKDLAQLEALYLAELKTGDLRDQQELKLAIAQNPELPEGVHRVAILAAPDLPPLLDRWVQGCLDKAVPVILAVHAPKEMEGAFDVSGRPLPAFWGEDADMTLPLPAESIHLRHDAVAQAESVIALLRDLAPSARVAVGVCDAEVSAILQEKLALEEVRVFEPGGVPVQKVGLWHVLNTFRALLTSGSWKPFATLLRVPEVRESWMGKAEGGLRVLTTADNFASEHMPVTLRHAKELLGSDERDLQLGAVIDAALALIERMKVLTPSQAARALIMSLYGDRPFKPDAPQDQLVTELASEWLRLVSEVESESRLFRLKLSMDEALALSLDMLAQTQLSEPRGEVDLVLQGWLELMWERAPNLVVSGLNEEHVPGILIGHPFLPDKVRREFNLPSQASRFARDAYLLRMLAEQRLTKGALHVLCGQWSERGDSLRPSRLLFLCQGDELPQRVEHLFPKEEHASGKTEPARTLAWKLQPKAAPNAVETISASRMRSYLECPFRYYLSSELHMESVDPRKRELGADEFGNLIHHAFQRIAKDPLASKCTDADELADFLIEAAMAQSAILYGQRPAPLIMLQLESLKQRLRHAAEYEAAQRQEGWQILHAELDIGKDDEEPLLIADASFRARIDRVERNAKSGHIRILDFKTSDKARSPIEAHVAKVTGRRKISEADEWKCFDGPDGNRYQWKDLQLPLYAAALKQRGLTPQAVGYFALPKSVQDTRIELWEDFSEAWIPPALECAAEIVQRIRAGVFWPPAARAFERDFDALFLGDILATVEPPAVKA